MPSFNITIEGPDGSFGGYLASPASGKGPGIVVIQEIFGVNAVMRETCDALAKEGFFALCPDLFWRIEPGIDITDQSEEEWKRAFELFNAFNVDTGVSDIAASVKSLRSVKGCTGKVGTVGYCLGGFLAYLSATRTDSDANIGYYGVNIQTKLDEKAKISRPLMLHIAGEDEFVPSEAQEAVKTALKDVKDIALHSYPGLGHAFARQGGAHFDKENAAKANDRSLAFFKAHLS